MKHNPSHLQDLYDLTDDLDRLPDEEINPSFASLQETASRYEIIELIAGGGMKQVFKAYDHFTRRHVAMAQLNPRIPRARFDPFIHEAWITAQLDHPNIIKVHDIGITPDQRPFFTMDLKTGDTLEQYIGKQDPARRLDAQNLDLFLRICDAAAYAHNMGILHLDLKPANIQLGRFGRMVVCDWGLARIRNRKHAPASAIDGWNLDMENGATQYGHIKGTPGYMAPEQTDPQAGKSERTDIYALGCILYFFLTGTPPLSGTPQEIIDQTLRGAFAEKLQRDNQLPPPLQSIIIKAAAPAPENRYQQVEQLIRDIRKYQDGYSPSAQQTGFAAEALLFYRRNKKLCTLILFSGALLLLMSALFISRLQHSRLQEHQARLKAQQALALYDREHTALNELSQTYSNEKYELGVQLSNEYFFGNPLGSVERALKGIEDGLKLNPGNEQLARQKIYFHFLTLNFDAARRFLESNPQEITIVTDLIGIINAMPEITGAADRPSVSGFIDVIQEMRSSEDALRRKALVIKMLTYDHACRTDFSRYDGLIREIIHFYNPDWNPAQYSYNSETQQLALHGQHLSQLAASWVNNRPSILAALPVTSLDISNTGIYSLTHLLGLNLQELDISGTLIADLSAVDQFPALRHLTVSANQFSREQLDALPNHLTVTVRN